MGMQNSTIFAEVDMMAAGILGLAFILLVVFCVMAAKTWHWVNIVFVVLTFIAGVGAIFGLTEVYHLRSKAIAEVDKAEKHLEKVEAAADEQIFGDPTSLSYDPGSLRYINEALIREMAGRGRVWSRGQVTAEGNTRQFTFSQTRPVGPDVQSLKDVVLYAFLEQPVSDQLYPVGYIGSVRVIEESPESVKLEHVALADVKQFAQPTGTWTLFEKMPLDRRDSFKQATISFVESNPDAPADIKAFVDGLRDESTDLDITGFRQILMSNFLAAASIGFDPASREYEQLIDSYAFDGLSIGKIQNWIDQNSAGRKSTRFEPSPEEVFVKYKFNKKSSRTYQVDELSGAVENEGLFNTQGHAIDTALHHGKEVEFSEGDTVLVDQRSADGYQRGVDQLIPPFASGEDVTLIDRIYVRPVRDFPYEFLSLSIHAAKVSESIARVTKSNAVQEESLGNARAQIEERTRLKSELESDQNNLKNDLDTINGLSDQVAQQVSELKQKISVLETGINSTYTKLRNLTITLSRKAFAGR
jgi:hypothetical protein